MSVDTTDLELRVRTLEVEQASNRLNKLEKQATKTERATDGLTNAFKKLAGPVLALVSATAALNKLVEVQRQFDTLNAGLLTATKSAAGAATAFEALQEFAAKTPYDLAQAVEGFTQLVNLGLTPSEKALTSFGNTASAMGKDLSQMIGAVADAATGEFERLKEFGIKAKVEGDKVSFVFQGVKTSVGNNAAEIEKYLTDLGDNQFAGAMEKRMVTLDGAMANLGDTWDMLFLNISKSGVGALIEEQVRLATDALQEINDMLASGEMDAYLQASTIAWSGWGRDIADTVDILSKLLKDTWEEWGSGAEGAGKGMYLGFKEFPVEVRAYFQEAAVEVTTFFHNAAIEAQYGWDLVKAAVSKDETFKDVTARYKEQMKQSNEVYTSMIDDISQEKDANLNAINEKIQAGKDLRTEYDKQLEARKALNEDRLAGFKVGGDGGKSGPTTAEVKEAAAKAKAQKKEFDALVQSLNTEEEAIAASYEKRRAIIERNTGAESSARSGLMERLEKDRQKELDALHGVEQAYEKRMRLAGEVAAIEESMWTDSQKAAYAYQQQIETLWQAQQAGVISAQQQKDMVNGVTTEYEKQQETQEETFFDLDELSKQAARNSQDAFADFLFDPFSQGLDGMLVGFLKVVQRMAAEAAAAQLAGKLFGSSGGGSGSGWLGTLIGIGASFFGGGGGATAAATAGGAAQGAANFGSQFSPSVGGGVSFPGRASGGPTVGGQMYEVSEKGPELYNENGRSYLLSGQGGSVTPLSGGSQSSSEGGVTINQVFNIDRGGNVSESGSTPDDQDSSKFAGIMKNVAVQAIREEQAPGGLLWNQTESRNG